MDDSAAQIRRFRATLRALARWERRPKARERYELALSFVEKAGRGQTCATDDEVAAFMAYFSGLDMEEPGHGFG